LKRKKQQFIQTGQLFWLLIKINQQTDFFILFNMWPLLGGTELHCCFLGSRHSFWDSTAKFDHNCNLNREATYVCRLTILVFVDMFVKLKQKNYITSNIKWQDNYSRFWVTNIYKQLFYLIFSRDMVCWVLLPFNVNHNCNVHTLCIYTIKHPLTISAIKSIIAKRNKYNFNTFFCIQESKEWFFLF
jgi:hypothetical protein